MRFFRIDFLIIFFLKFYFSYCSDIFANDPENKSEKIKKNIKKSTKKIKSILKKNKSNEKEDKNKNYKNKKRKKVTFNENVEVIKFDKMDIVSSENIDKKFEKLKYRHNAKSFKNMNRIKRSDSKRNNKNDYRYPYILKKKRVCGCCCKN